MDKPQYLALVSKAHLAANSYYQGDTEQMTDAEYDALILQIEDIGAANGWTDHLILDAVAAGTQVAAGQKTVEHKRRMLSLQKAQNAEELGKFIEKTENLSPLTLEPKLDGLAVVAHYQDGKRVLVATRGDSMTGEVLTDAVNRVTIKGLPATIPVMGTVEVRGELLLTRPQFAAAQKVRLPEAERRLASYIAKNVKANPKFVNDKTAEDFLYRNPRNAAAGVIRALMQDDADASPLRAIPFTFALYDYVTDAPAKRYSEYLDQAEKVGFYTARAIITSQPGYDAEKSIGDLVIWFGLIRENIDYPTDGAVVKVDRLAVRDSLGEGSKYPHWAIAYKYEAEVKTTTLRDIKRYVGRTGAISYVAQLDEVELAETIVTKATLNNAEFIANLDLHIGDIVQVRKANEIIPEVVGVVTAERAGKNLTPYQAPNTCPNCDSILSKASVIWRCANPECSSLERVVYAVSRDHLDIEGLSSGILEVLVRNNLIKDQGDLFFLTATQIAGAKTGRINQAGEAITIGSTVANKLVAEIQKAKGAALNRLLSSLGVRHLGRTMSRRFAAHFKSFDAAVNATVAQMQQVEGVKEKALEMRAGLDKVKPLLDKYRKVGFDALTAKADTAQPAGKQPFTGEVICVTGSVPGLTRTQVQEFIESNGGTAASSVSARITLLVAPADERTSSKAKKALDLGKTIITPEEFLARAGR